MSIHFRNVSKSFGSRVILNQIHFEVKKGEILFILGRSGVGKSVTLKHIVGLLHPDSGDVLVDGQAVKRLNSLELAQIRRKCGMVFQHPALLDSLTLFDNIAFGLRTPQYLATVKSPLTKDEEREIVLQKLELVHLSPDILECHPSEISYGMQKRVSLARALAPEPSYLLFDEPTTGLDPITTQAVNNLIYNLSRKLQVTSIVVSHDINCALNIADRILVLDRGEILEHASVAEIKISQKLLIREFLAEVLAI